MAETRLKQQGSPTGIRRLLFRAPIALFRVRLGFLLTRRFVMIEHVGRRSGEVRRTVLEVVLDDPDAVYVAAAWGSRAHWYQNIMASPQVIVHLGSTRFHTVAKVVDETTANRVLVEYGRRHPRALRVLAGFMLDQPGDTLDEIVTRVAATVPLVFLPKR